MFCNILSVCGLVLIVIDDCYFYKINGIPLSMVKPFCDLWLDSKDILSGKKITLWF